MKPYITLIEKYIHQDLLDKNDTPLEEQELNEAYMCFGCGLCDGLERAIRIDADECKHNCHACWTCQCSELECCNCLLDNDHPCVDCCECWGLNT